MEETRDSKKVLNSIDDVHSAGMAVIQVCLAGMGVIGVQAYEGGCARVYCKKTEESGAQRGAVDVC
jgi:hypothetical protein